MLIRMPVKQFWITHVNGLSFRAVLIRMPVKHRVADLKQSVGFRAVLIRMPVKLEIDIYSVPVVLELC